MRSPFNNRGMRSPFGRRVVTVPPIELGDALLLEIGDTVLLENGDKLLLEAT